MSTKPASEMGSSLFFAYFQGYSPTSSTQTLYNSLLVCQCAQKKKMGPYSKLKYCITGAFLINLQGLCQEIINFEFGTLLPQLKHKAPFQYTALFRNAKHHILFIFLCSTAVGSPTEISYKNAIFFHTVNINKSVKITDSLIEFVSCSEHAFRETLMYFIT